MNNITTQKIDSDIWAKVSTIEGWMSDDEAEILYEIASTLKNKGSLVEIGSWCGKSLVLMSLAAKRIGFNKPIYSIDPFLTSKNEPNGKYDEFISNLKKYNVYDNITHIKDYSQAAGQNFNENIEFIYIDGFHRYDVVKTDFELFYPHVIEEGYIAFHDVFDYYGPTKLLSEILKTDNTFCYEKSATRLVVAKKVKELTKENITNNNKFLERLEASIARNNLRM